MTKARLVSMMLVALLGATGLTVVGGAPPAMADPPAVSNHVVTWGTQDLHSEPPAGLTDVVAVAVNPASSLALKSDGTLVQWPDPGVSASLVGVDHVVAIAGNSDYFMALKADGTVVAAGQDANGQVTVPVGLTGVKAIAAGPEHRLAVKTDGTVVAWGGNNDSGELDVPAGLTDVVAVAAGEFHSVALKSNGTPVIWGNPAFASGAIGGLKAIAAGYAFTVGLRANGTVRTWPGSAPLPPAGLTDVTAIAAGGFHALALKSDGTVVGWGSNGVGETSVPTVTGATAIAASEYRSALVAPLPAAVTSLNPSSGSAAGGNPVVITGTRFTGATRVAFGSRAATSFAVDSDTQITAIAPRGDPGPAHVQVTATGGASRVSPSDVYNRPPAAGTRVTAWGPDDNAVAGENEAPPGGVRDAVAVAAGKHTSVALKADGSVVAWGSNENGLSTVPAGLHNALAVVPQSTYTVAVRTDGSLIDWGAESATGNKDVVKVAFANPNGLALRGDGTVVHLFGDYDGNAGGPLDRGQFLVPSGLNGVVDLAGGWSHFVALKGDGTVVTWGGADFDGLAVPAGLTGVVAVGAGYGWSMALKADGTVVAWGDNSLHQTDVPAGLSNVVAISGSVFMGLALKSDGTLVAWGQGDYPPAGLTGGIAIGAGETHSLAIVANNPPQVQAGTDRAGQEGSPASFGNAVVTDPDGDPVSSGTWSVTPGPGVDAGAACVVAPNGTVGQTITCTDDGTYTVTYTAADDSGLSGSGSFIYTVGNVAPVLGALSGPSSSVAAGSTANVSAAVSDVGTNDTQTCSVNWGDTVTTVGTIGSGSCAGSHAYAAAGTYTASMTATDDDGAASTAATRSITVTTVAQSIDFAQPAGRTYGDAPFTVSATASSGLPVSFSVGSGGPCTISGTTVTITGAGTCSITALQAGNSSYAAAPAVTRDVVVTKGMLQVKADAKSRTQGTANPPLTYTVTGFVNGETATALSGAPSLTTTATQSSPVGDYPITIAAGSLSAANYSFAFTGAVLTVFVPPLDTDHDGVPNATDPDDDNDGIPDAKDGYPLEKDGVLSGAISQQIAANPSLRAALAPVHAVLLALGV